eukprot:CAMPEP_0204630950 /NCGR_PEP_ID=MMETSP0717-20131115/21633_1 /ASSEMBLY_ACC=CAM_ASM_000666 /TAXON_ID=230516 /ORGANISM="Chaetoceros curvisetus" /LENGTH=260 /DNA_ID=CAMNT_0051648377 /DNA_START=49 /DNA_END=831 /DNA_ORIENTATION=+
MAAESKATYGSIPVANVVEIISITAPSAMNEGFVFDAIHNGVVFPVTVPAGGVKEGEVIQVPFKPLSDTISSGSPGKWKDDIFACSRYGIFHPSFLYACCCHFVLLAQVMTRLRVNWKADPAVGDEWKKTFRNVIVISCVYGFLKYIFMLAPEPGMEDDNVEVIGFVVTFEQIIGFIYWLYMLYVVSKTRKLVRQRDGISDENCVGCEDVACALCCGCCTVSQMARQTAHYDTEEAAFFTIDGLESKPTEIEPLVPVVDV